MHHTCSLPKCSRSPSLMNVFGLPNIGIGHLNFSCCFTKYCGRDNLRSKTQGSLSCPYHAGRAVSEWRVCPCSESLSTEVHMHTVEVFSACWHTQHTPRHTSMSSCVLTAFVCHYIRRAYSERFARTNTQSS